MLGSQVHSSIAFVWEGGRVLKLKEDLEQINNTHGKKLDN